MEQSTRGVNSARGQAAERWSRQFTPLHCLAVDCLYGWTVQETRTDFHKEIANIDIIFNEGTVQQKDYTSKSNNPWTKGLEACVQVGMINKDVDLYTFHWTHARKLLVIPGYHIKKFDKKARKVNGTESNGWNDFYAIPIEQLTGLEHAFLYEDEDYDWLVGLTLT